MRFGTGVAIRDLTKVKVLQEQRRETMFRNNERGEFTDATAFIEGIAVAGIMWAVGRCMTN